MNMTQKYIANTIVMVKPSHFCFNAETSISNAFQNKPDIGNDDLQHIVKEEFNSMVKKIRSNGINVIVLESLPNTPDAVFPNNWFSTHIIDNNPYVIVYPMCTKNRRKEVQIGNMTSNLKKITGGDYKILDIRSDYSRFLESTGCLYLTMNIKLLICLYRLVLMRHWQKKYVTNLDTS